MGILMRRWNSRLSYKLRARNWTQMEIQRMDTCF
jgi:hypothetical protein